MNKIRSINAAAAPKQNFVFGSIISGTYSNYKHDPHPTILCLGCYTNQKGAFVHGIQLHNNANLGWILNVIKNIKNSGTITNPKLFYNYIKLNNPLVLKNYRTYHLNMSNFKTVAPGFSNINLNYCYPINDERDNFVRELNGQNNFINKFVDTQQLRFNITKVINTVKVW